MTAEILFLFIRNGVKWANRKKKEKWPRTKEKKEWDNRASNQLSLINDNLNCQHKKQIVYSLSLSAVTCQM